MDKEWIPIIGTLLGVLFGGGISSITKILELRHQTKRENHKILLSKLEEFHELTSEFLLNFNEGNKDIVKLSMRQWTLAELSEIHKPLNLTIQKMNTLQAIYAPELRTIWHLLTENMSKQQMTAQNFLLNKATKVEILNQYQEVSKTCQSLLDAIENKISKELGN